MGTLKIRADAVVTGPLFDGRAARAAQEWAEKTSQALGDEGVKMLRQVPMNKSGRATGAFQEKVQAVRRSPSEVRIAGPQERGVVWASWLEGVSKRNQSTGFKGYRLFRKTRQALDEKATEIGQRELEKLLPEMGGA